MKDIRDSRREIDEIDAGITRLFLLRMGVAADISKYKRANNLPVWDPARERAKLNDIAGSVPRDMRGYAKKLYETLFEVSREYQTARQARNVAIIGMPGCGKTSVGRALAGLSGRELWDTDEMVVRKSGRSIPEIFEKQGEAAFRRMETEALMEAEDGEGRVIAAGGGIVTVPENRERIRKGIVVYITRPLSLLHREGRPLSLSVGVEELYRQRAALYEEWSDARYENDQIEDAASRIDADWL